jgi:NTP pyrophosphatase (non-canonical NTP hydrolase)
MMTFDEYMKKALATWTPPKASDAETAQTIAVLGIVGEAGEIGEKWKKVLARYDGFEMTAERVADFEKELGDVLWYVAVFADSLGLSLDEIARKNNLKLADRQKRGVLTKGAGDYR